VTLSPRKKIGPITATELLAASSEIYEAMKTYRDGQTDSQNKAGKGKGAIADTYRQIIIYETLCKLFESTRPEPNASVAEIYRNVKFHKILNALQHQVAVSTEKKKTGASSMDEVHRISLLVWFYTRRWYIWPFL
jgi:hypothetical protein